MKQRPDLIKEISSTSPNQGELVYWWIGQHSYIIKTASKTIYLDPFLTDMERRMVKPILAPEDITNADIVTGSHDHIDHIDREALPGLMSASPQAKLLVPKIARESLASEFGNERVTGMDAGETFEDGDLTITALPAAHEFFDHDEAYGYPYLGFVIETDGVVIYHSGDTCMYDGLVADLSPWDISVAFLPINGRDAVRLRAGCIGNMTYQEAVDLAGSIRPALTVPSHYGMFAGNTVDPELFVDYLDAKYPDLKCCVPQIGVAMHWPGQ